MRKRALSLVLILVMCLSLLPMTALAADDGLTIENGVLTTCNGPGGDVTIPDGVTSIGKSAFVRCASLISITIPDSVTSIGDEAFLSCSSLSSITLPDSVTSIGKRAFMNCTGLVSVTIPSGVTDISDGMFEQCDNLTHVVIPDSVTRIGNNAFENCKNLASVEIPSSVTSIGSHAFDWCGKMSRVTVPSSVTKIGEYAFYDCILEGEPGSYVERYAKEYRYTFVSTQDSDFVLDGTTLKEYVGSGGSVTIPNGVTSIGRNAFFECNSLTDVTIPDSVTSIGDYAFGRCEGLTRVIVPASVTSIGKSAFPDRCVLQGKPGSYADRYANDRANTYYFASTQAPDFAVDGTTLVKYLGPLESGEKTVEIPDWITAIGKQAFYQTYKEPGSSRTNPLIRVIVPGSVTEIDPNAFYGKFLLQGDRGSYVEKYTCSNIFGFAYNDAPDIIVGRSGALMLGYAGSGKRVVIPDSVVSIADQAISHNDNITSVTIPVSVTTIGEYQYGPNGGVFSYCKNLTDIYYEGTKVQWASIKFDDVSETSLNKITIHCSDGDITWAETGETEEKLTYTITLDPMGGTVEPTSFIVVYNSTTYLPTPVRDGYIFKGWSDSPTASSYRSSYTLTEREDKTLYAHWAEPKVYTVTLDATGGTVSPSSIEVTEGGRFGVLPTPVRDGVVFRGWYTKPVGGSRVGSRGTITWGTGRILYAQWFTEVELDQLMQQTLDLRKRAIASSSQGEGYQTWLKANRETLSRIEERHYANTIITPAVQAQSDAICKGLTTDEAKVLAIHQWVTNNIYYDHPLLSDEHPMPTAQTVLDRRSYVCSGYAVLTQALCWAQKIPCVYVTGQTTRGYHAWNAVQVNGEWSWIDATWDTFNAYYGGDEWISGNTRLNYYCCSSEFLATDHGAVYIQAINGVNAYLPSQTAAETEQLLQREQKLEEDKEHLRELAEDAKKDPTLSDWAKEETATAIQEGLVPNELMSSYSDAITREEFCTLMVTMLERRSGKTIAEFAASKGVKYTQPFADTNNINVGYAHALGIVNGISSTEFVPENSITRQEAATMLARAGKVLGLNAAAEMSFDDKAQFADWASDSISYVSGLSDTTNGKRVMGGTGNGNFSPLDTYSRQQAILTSLRIFHCAG